MWTLVTRTPVLCLLLAAVTGCGGDDAEGNGAGTDASTGSSSSGDGSGEATSTTTSADESGGTTSTASSSGDTTGSTSDPGSEASSTGSAAFPVDCDDGGLPVRVDGGGEYATVNEGVTATPPGGTLWVCPGEYTEAMAIQIQRDVAIVGAGPDVVSINAEDGLDRVFLVRNASVTFEGMSIVGAGFGIDVGYEENEPRVTTMRNLRVAQSRQAGIFIFEGGGVELENARAVFEQVTVEEVASDGGTAPALGGVALYGVDATFVDTIIRDNVTRSGGLEVQDSRVEFEGGQVVRNEATTPNGGGARLLTDAAAQTFTIIDSDWGSGAEEENTPNDMDCGSGVSNDVGWLGNPASAVCGTDVDGCCTPR